MRANLLAAMLVLLPGIACGADSSWMPSPYSPLQPTQPPSPAQPVAISPRPGPASLPQTRALQVPAPVQPVRYQAAPYASAPTPEFPIQLEPPGLERISRLDSDQKLQERIRQESIERGEKADEVRFPESPILSRDPYQSRYGLWATRVMTVEPNFTNYHKLYFEDKNSERYGWELGLLQPVVSAAYFYKDLAVLPGKLANSICDCGESDAGLCLPGDPVPYMLYPPDLTLTATAAELGTIALLIAVFP
jgi:hypothetical protein